MKKLFYIASLVVMTCGIVSALGVQQSWFQAIPVADVVIRPAVDDTGHNGWTASSGTDRYAMVDEVISDDDTTYIYRSDSEASQRFTNLPTNLPNRPILGVIVCYNGRIAAGSGFYGDSVIGVNGTSYYSTDDTLSGTYAEFCHEWTTNPNTAAAWLKADVEGTGSNPLQNWGVWPEALGASDTIRATQLSLTVRYN